MEENSNQQIEIDLPQDMAYGVYSNLAIISHSPTEFVSDFIQLTPKIYESDAGQYSKI